MKKLMTMIAAVAMSFGLFAATEGEYAADSVETGLNAWSGTTTESAQGDYEADGVTPYAYSTTERYGGFDNTNAKYLKVKNTLGKESIDLAIDPVAVADSVCFDTVVNFTNGSEDDIAELPTDSKLAVWLKELAAADDEVDGVGETNLYVRAGFWDGDAYVQKNFLIPDSGVEPGSWHRVTVSTIANVLSDKSGNKLPGFVVYLDGVLVAHNDDAKIGRTGLDTVAAAYNNNNNLFISAVGEEEAPTISALGFSGTGLADDASIVYGDAIPAFAKAATLSIDADDGVTGFKYSIGGADPVTVAGDSATAQIQVGQTVVLTDITVENSDTAARKVADINDWDVKNLVVSGTGFQFEGGATASLTIGVEETAFIVKVNGKGYTDEEEAIAAIDAATSGTVSFLGEDGFAYADGAKGTINFNQGDTITVREDDGAWIINSEGEITITDVKAGAEIIVQTGDVEVEGTIAGKLLVYGKCNVSAALTINNSDWVELGDEAMLMALAEGEDGFACDEEELVTLGEHGCLQTVASQTEQNIFTEPASGKKIKETELPEDAGYQYTLVDLATVLVTVENTGAIVTGVETGDYTEGEKVTFTVAPAEGYKTPITVTGAESTGTDGEYAFTVGTEPITITVTATAKEIYTVTFKTNNCEVAFATKQVTEGEKLGDFATPAAIPGYTGAWDAPAPTADDVINANMTYNWTYTADTYTITYMCDDGVTPFTQFKQEATIPYSYTVAEVVTLPGAEAIDEALGGTWEAWTNANGVAVANTTGLMGNLTVFAQIKQQGSPGADVVKNSVEGADDIKDPVLKAALEANATTLSTTLGGPDKVAAWAANVYTSGKIPAEKLANADATDIAISTTFDLPIMVEPTIDAPAVIAAEEGPAAFAFAIKDGATAIEIKTVTDNVKKLIKYASALAGEGAGFDYAKDTEVKIDVNEAKDAVTAEFVAGPAAGFMKADFTTVDKE